MRTQISSKDAARIYKSSGGAYDASDAVGVAVPTYGADGQNRAGRAANATPSQAGITMDSGIAERCKTLYALLEAASHRERILQVSYPVERVQRPEHQPLQVHASRNPALLRGRTRLLDRGLQRMLYSSFG